MSDRGLLCRVAPFRYLRIKDHLHLPVAFRSLSRLSSALSAKASTLRPFLLNLRSAASEFIFFRSLVLKMSPSHGDSCSVDFTSSARKLVFDAFASYCLLLSQYLVSDLSDNYLSDDNSTSLSWRGFLMFLADQYFYWSFFRYSVFKVQKHYLMIIKSLTM